MAVTIVDSPSEVRIRSAAARAASVAPDTAMPMSLRLRAGASFTPSPVIPTMVPFLFLRASTMMNLCSGYTWAKPSAFSISDMRSRFRPWVISTPWPGRSSLVSTFMPRPSTRQVSMAMACWSPVIILMSTPKAWAFSMVSLVSGRGGSKNVSSPISSQRPRIRGWAPAVRATPSARMPRRARSAIWASTSFLLMLATRSSTTWGAPFITRNSSPLGETTCASVNFLLGSKGVKSSCCHCASSVRSMEPSTSVSSASLGGSRHLAARQAYRSTSASSALP
mmetsp:Transcript_15342/g.43521  ORF Transcript_15342/g.43521 Transcript_15342/m.43521 type:complete len:280 (+) Transcript_15342:1059-1898(+)